MKYKIILITLLFLLTGCYNYRELNDLAIISAIGIKKDNNIKLTIQVLDTNDTSPQNKDANYIIFNTEGKTIQEALRNVMKESSKRLFINHMQVLIIDEETAKEGIKEIIDFFFRDPESRKQYEVLITNDDIKKVLETDTMLEKINGKNIKESIKKNSIFLNNINNITFTDLIKTYLNPNKELLITSIKIDNNRLKLDKTAIFKEDKLIGYINEEDTKYYNFITNKIDDTLLNIPINNKESTIEVINNKTNIKTINNNIYITLNIKATINEINNDFDLKDNKTIKYLEQYYSNYLKNEIEKSINNIIKQYNSDIYGFKDIIYKNNYKYFINNKITLNDIKININTNIKLSHKGNGDEIIHEKN